jgi:hypothetical protein
LDPLTKSRDRKPPTDRHEDASPRESGIPRSGHVSCVATARRCAGLGVTVAQHGTIRLGPRAKPKQLWCDAVRAGGSGTMIRAGRRNGRGGHLLVSVDLLTAHGE